MHLHTYNTLLYTHSRCTIFSAPSESSAGAELYRDIEMTRKHLLRRGMCVCRTNDKTIFTLWPERISSGGNSMWIWRVKKFFVWDCVKEYSSPRQMGVLLFYTHPPRTDRCLRSRKTPVPDTSSVELKSALSCERCEYVVSSSKDAEPVDDILELCRDRTAR